MAAATLSLSFSLDPQHHHHHFYKPRQAFISPLQFPKYPLAVSHKSDRYVFKPSSSSSSSSSSSPSPSPSSTTTTTTTVSPSGLSYLSDPLRTGRFLSNEELEKLKFLEHFMYSRELRSGSLWVRAMRADEMDITVALLAESFAESMLLPSAYNSLLRFLVKQYLIERRAVMPHAVTLVGFFRERKENGDGDEEEQGGEEEKLAGTVEICFDKRGANASPPTPTPPKNSPYICNMTVKEQLRRLVWFVSRFRTFHVFLFFVESWLISMFRDESFIIFLSDSSNWNMLLRIDRHNSSLTRTVIYKKICESTREIYSGSQYDSYIH